MNSFAIKLLFLSLFLVAIHGWVLTVRNNVNPCAGRSYPTIKLFWAGGAQQDIPEGNDYVFNDGDSQIPPTGLGIQENGEYCRCCGNEPPCNNPDNAGMELVVNQGDCLSYQLNDPFYCGAHPPNAKGIVSVAMSGAWPNCVATLTRLANAPNCQSSC
eukprot:Phypoly_transcript_19244.p1 GENE.Phypoly_transcript_19244~~Phypoly_transcript_19244.p1  ORF type:complete len:158 (+),score=20.14 Phypoly_transcript_19244:162-635(+)